MSDRKTVEERALRGAAPKEVGRALKKLIRQKEKNFL